MPRDDIDRNLLFGLLAIQTGLIDRRALSEALRAWTLDKSRTLAAILAEQGALPGSVAAMLEALMAEHVKAHDGDPTKSLATIEASPSTLEMLVKIGDPDVEATLPLIGSDSTAPAPSGTAGGPDVSTSAGGGRRFRIIRPHARGGLGAVYVALDEELNREVALKQILERHADDPSSRSRFLLEAEITGGLEHPGIVPVYGLGTFGDGRPYYAMRFIKGDSLKEAIARFHRKGGPAGEAPTPVARKAQPAESRELELRKLLRRFLDVCNAIEYAHQRGVLHRDLKPGNVMVGKYGETLVVDWGLAKASDQAEPGTSEGERPLSPSHSSGTVETLPGSAIGTPSYMSPEQADGNLGRIGPRSDVYSLGATLYCLLTGKPPFEGPDAAAILHLVREGGPTPPRKHDPRIDPALEAICLKAMAHSPEGRYPTPAALAEEVDRWMADEPVAAFPEPKSREVARWARRHSSAVTGGLVFLLAAVLSLGLVTWLTARQNARLEVARQETQKQADRARTGSAMARAAVKSMLHEVSRDDLLNVPQAEGLRVSLAERALAFYSEFVKLNPGQAEFELEHARFEDQVAGLYRMTGKYDLARAEYNRAIEILDDLVARDPGATTALEFLAYTEGQLAESIKMAGGTEAEAEPHHRESIRVASMLWARHPEVAKYARSLALASNDLADSLIEAGRPGEAEPLIARGLEAAMAFQASLATKPDPKKFELVRIIPPMVRTTRGATLARLGRRAEAEAELARSTGSIRSLLAAYPQPSNDFQYHLVNGLRELADVQATDPARIAEALRVLDEAVDLLTSLTANYPKFVHYHVFLVTLRADRGRLRLASGQRGPALEDLAFADGKLAERLLDPKARARPFRERGQVKANLARLADLEGRREPARSLAAEAIALQEKALAFDPDRPADRTLLDQHRATLRSLAGPGK